MFEACVSVTRTCDIDRYEISAPCELAIKVISHTLCSFLITFPPLEHHIPKQSAVCSTKTMHAYWLVLLLVHGLVVYDTHANFGTLTSPNYPNRYRNYYRARQAVLPRVPGVSSEKSILATNMNIVCRGSKSSGICLSASTSIYDRAWATHSTFSCCHRTTSIRQWRVASTRRSRYQCKLITQG